MAASDDLDLGEDGALRPSRTSEKLKREANEAALAQLGKRMVSLGASKLAFLDLPEEILDAVEDARKMTSAPALGRQMRRIRGFLRDLDWTSMLRRLDAKSAGIAFDEEEGRPDAVQWSTELPLHGDRGLGRFLELYPNGDRKRLRQLAMNVARSTEAKRTKARKQLQMVIEGTIVEFEKLEARKNQQRAASSNESEDEEDAPLFRLGEEGFDELNSEEE